jgi:hypothetical protein
MKPVHPVFRLSGLVALSVGLVACIGGIDHPDQFGDGTYCPPDVDVPALFRERCGGSICHGSGSDPAGELDLESPGVAGRMIAVPSEECEGRLRIVPGAPDQSFLIDKLVGPPPGCGQRMPVAVALSDDEVTCIRRWILEVSTPDGGAL